MAYETLLVGREESFAVITLNRPPANAISPQLMTELNDALSGVESDHDVRVVIITGAGDRIFCAGADLGSAFSGGDLQGFIRFGNGVLRRMERLRKPVIAAGNPHALGGGGGSAIGRHLPRLQDGAPLGPTEANLAALPGELGTQRLAP